MCRVRQRPPIYRWSEAQSRLRSGARRTEDLDWDPTGPKSIPVQCSWSMGYCCRIAIVEIECAARDSSEKTWSSEIERAGGWDWSWRGMEGCLLCRWCLRELESESMRRADARTEEMAVMGKRWWHCVSPASKQLVMVARPFACLAACFLPSSAGGRAATSTSRVPHGH